MFDGVSPKENSEEIASAEWEPSFFFIYITNSYHIILCHYMNWQARVAPFLFLLLLPLLPPPLSVSGGDSLESEIYTSALNQGYCVRVTNQTGWIGCGLPSGGLSGTIRLVADQSSLTSLLNNPPTDRLALLLSPTLFTMSNMVAISNTLNVAGVMVLPTDSSATSGPIPPPGGRSPFTSTPQYLPGFSPSTAIPGPIINPPLFNNTYTWNTLGNSLSLQQFNFAIVSVTYTEQSYVLNLAQTNEVRILQGEFAYYVAEFEYYMYAQENSIQCLTDTTCMPVGGYSVWGSLGNTTFNTTNNPLPPSPGPPRPLLLAVTAMDATGFFHQMTPGGDASQASVAVLAAAINVLSFTPGVTTLPSQIMFAFFQGEEWSHVGSRKFVDDIINFECIDYNSPVGAECNNPYKNTLDFQAIKIQNIKKIIEVGQIGLNSTGRK